MLDIPDIYQIKKHLKRKLDVLLINYMDIRFSYKIRQKKRNTKAHSIKNQKIILNF